MATNAEQLLISHRHRYSVDDYYRMAEAGIVAPGARVELIDGEMIEPGLEGIGIDLAQLF
jgi:hypothetical protein